MAKYQYRLTGTFLGLSSVGSAVVALGNKLASGKRITVRSIEFNNQTLQYSGASAGQIGAAIFGRCTVAEDGRVVTPTKLDSNAAAWPSGVKVGVGGVVNVGTMTPFFWMDISRRVAATTSISLQWFGTAVHQTTDGKYSKQMRAARRGNGPSTLQRIVIRPGEAVGLVVNDRMLAGNNCAGAPHQVDLTLKFGSKTYQVSTTMMTTQAIDTAYFTINNTSASDVVELMEYAVAQIGSAGTPYYQVVPINGAEADPLSDPIKQAAISRMDSAYPDPTTWVYALHDTPVAPFGVPQEYVAQGSALAGKGFNYLHTKDFIGPVWRTLFPEVYGMGPTNSVNSVLEAFLPKFNTDLLLRNGAGIVLREGEGMAICVAAETVNATAFIDLPAFMMNHEWSICFDVEDKNIPDKTFTGLPVGTEITIRQGSKILAHQQDVNTGSFTWQYDASNRPARVQFTMPGYVFEDMNIVLDATNQTLPVTYAPDPSYV